MPAATFTTSIGIPAARVWSFVDDYENWAPLFPGYQGHRLTGDGGSVWTVRGDLGMFSRIVEIDVRITERRERESVAFAVKGTYENVAGSGAFRTAPRGPEATDLTFVIDLRAGGPMAPMINGLLRARLSRMVEEFGRALAGRIERGGDRRPAPRT